MNTAVTDLEQVKYFLSIYQSEKSQQLGITFEILTLLTNTVSILCDKVQRLTITNRSSSITQKLAKTSSEQVITKESGKTSPHNTNKEVSQKKHKRESEPLKKHRKKSLELSLSKLEQNVSELTMKTGITPRSVRENYKPNSFETLPGESCFEKWTGKNMRIIYDSVKMPFNAKSLWSAVKDKKEMVLFVRTDKDYIFGGYFSKLPQKQGEWVVDPKHFIFRLNGDKGFKLVSTGRSDCLNIGEDSDLNRICTIGGFITIRNKQCIFHVEEDFNEFYVDFTGKGLRAFGDDSSFRVVRCWVTELVIK
ncbi:TLDc domain-containing protein [Entamoeba marina]